MLHAYKDEQHYLAHNFLTYLENVFPSRAPLKILYDFCIR